MFGLVEDTPASSRGGARAAAIGCCWRATLGLRFDAVAGGAQQVVEDTLLRWTRLMRERYGGDRLALGGGVFMNVKANMLLAGEEWVRDLFVFPSCGDESNAVGAAYLGYLDLCARAGVGAKPAPFGPAYLGPVDRRRRGRGAACARATWAPATA